MFGKEFTIKPHKSKKRKIHWHLLMIGDNGKVINFPKYKIFTFLIVLLLCITTTSTFWLLYLFQNSHRENKTLTDDLYNLDKVVGNLKSENELLAARLVLAGIEPNPERKKLIDSEVGNEPGLPKISGFATVSPQGLNAEEKDVISEKINEKKDNRAEELFWEKDSKKSDFVNVNDFTVKYESENNRLNVKFKLSNNSPKTVSGYLFVVLKNHQQSADQWLTLPEKFLDRNGIPSNYISGHEFKISRFKIVKFIAQHNKNLGKSMKAVIFVFGKNGDLLFKEEFPVEI